MNRWFVTITLLASVAALSGCLPRAIYQSPRVLSEGEYGFGAGLSCLKLFPGEEGLKYTGSAFYRTSTGENSDGGVAFHFTRATCATLAGDARWQLAEESFLVAGRGGAALSYWWGEPSLLQFAVEPGLVFGSDRVWGIVSCPLHWLLFSGEWLPYPAPYVGIGARIGNRLQLLPELGCNLSYWEEGQLFGCILGLGIQYQFGLAEDSDNLFGLRRTRAVHARSS